MSRSQPIAPGPRRHWPALLAMLGLLLAATAVAPLPAWVGDVATLCSANGSSPPAGAAEHSPCCVLCVVGGLAGPLPQEARLPRPRELDGELPVTAELDQAIGRFDGAARARAPPPV